MRVVISDDKTVDYDVEREVLAEAGASVETTLATTPEAVVEACEGAAGLIVNAGTPVTRAVFEACEDLRVVGRAGIGVDNVDVRAAADHGVTVVHVPDYCVDEVSTHALALLLGLVRSVPTYDRGTRAGEWDWEAGRPIRRLRGETLGLVAFGKIPRRLARKVDGFGLDVLAHDPAVAAHEMAHFGVEKVDFEELLARSDLLSVHAPLYEETEGLLDADAFERMGEGVVLVNTARGPVVDEVALADALEDGTVARAGLDVLEEEPPVNSPVVGREDVVVTPHAAWYSETSMVDLRRSVAEDVARVLDGEAPRAPVDPDTPWV